MTRNLMALVCALAFPAAAAEVLDATVETSSGAPQRLQALWSRPTVLFYEDRESTALNQHLKEALFARGQQAGLLGAVSVVAIANVAAFDWFPARDFVLAAVRDVEKQVKVPVYLDFKGALSAPPCGLSATGATVLVLDAAGRPVLSFTGRLSPRAEAQVFEKLEALLATKE